MIGHTTTGESADTWLRAESARLVAPPPNADELRADFSSMQAATEREGRLHAERRARMWRSAARDSARTTSGLSGLA